MSAIFIDGFGVTGFRSFGQELQKIGPFTQVNLFIGQNNSGKSNILRFISGYYKRALRAVSDLRAGFALAPLDQRLGSTGTITLALGVTLSGERLRRWLKQSELPVNEAKWVTKVLESTILTDGTGLAWFSYQGQGSSGAGFALSQTLLDGMFRSQVLKDGEWVVIWNRLTKRSGGNRREHWIPETLQVLLRTLVPAPPEVALIPAIRKVGEASAESEDYSGSGIIDQLAKLQNPDYDKQELKAKFEQVNTFLREVTGSQDARLEIPYERDKILVHMDSRVLPLSSLGMGIHEVIILASAATILENQIVCVEEPEIHLHPLLQKKLVRYLQENTTNQYFISTHSAHLLDTPGAAVFHVRLEDGASVVTAAINNHQRAAICCDLGYRASDLLQANCIIWVEGPSDRLYLRHWIASVAPDLEEGIHYSIMFYGGRLLSHLTADDPEIKEFISLRRLNRNLAIIIDSDRTYARQPLNDTKKRVCKEFDSGPGFAWVTKGREIENYVPPELLEEAVRAVYAEAIQLASVGQFEDCLQFRTQKGDIKSRVDKVKVAREVISHLACLDCLDLGVMIRKTVRFIRDANGLD